MGNRRLAFAGAVLVLAAACLDAGGAEKPKSGPPLGSKTASFNVQDVTGMAKGGKVCYI